MGYESPEGRARRNAKRKEMRPILRAKMDAGEFPRTVLRVCKDCGELKECEWQGTFTMSGKPEYRCRCHECHNKYKAKTARTNKRRTARCKHRTDNKLVHKQAAVDFLGGRCKICGETDIDKLTFHHRDPKTKKYEVGRLLGDGYSVYNEKIQEELPKCDVLCYNCHMKLHAVEKRKIQKGRYNEENI